MVSSLPCFHSESWMCGSVVHTHMMAVWFNKQCMLDSEQSASFMFEDNHRAESTVCASTTISNSLEYKHYWEYSKAFNMDKLKYELHNRSYRTNHFLM